MQYLPVRERTAYRRGTSFRRLDAPAMAIEALECGRALLHILLLPLLTVVRAVHCLNHLIRLSVNCAVAMFFTVFGLMFLSRLVFALAHVLFFPLLGY